eukprot:jgi/Botrbrau1/514/Bobra.110_2s0143.1
MDSSGQWCLSLSAVATCPVLGNNMTGLPRGTLQCALVRRRMKENIVPSYREDLYARALYARVISIKIFSVLSIYSLHIRMCNGSITCMHVLLASQ